MAGGLSIGYDPQNIGSKVQFGNTFPGQAITPNGAPAAPASNSGGQTLAATTSVPQVASGGAAPVAQTTAPAPPPTPNYDLLKDGVNKQYDQIQAALDAQAGFIPKERTNLESKVNSLFGGSQSSINAARDNAEGDLDRSEQKLDTRQADSLRALEENVRTQFESGQRILGGGTGSGSDMYSYALAKLSTQQKGDILRQANELHADLEVERSKVTRTYDEQQTQLNTWKDQQMIDIENWVLSQQKDIQNRKLTANAQRTQELNQVLAQTIETAQTYANSVASQAQQIQQGIDTWADSRLQSVDALSGQIQQGVLAIDPSQIQGEFDPGSGYFTGTAFNGGLSISSPGNSPFITALAGRREDE